jgi:hypothetical protein
MAEKTAELVKSLGSIEAEEKIEISANWKDIIEHLKRRNNHLAKRNLELENNNKALEEANIYLVQCVEFCKTKVHNLECLKQRTEGRFALFTDELQQLIHTHGADKATVPVVPVLPTPAPSPKIKPISYSSSSNTPVGGALRKPQGANVKNSPPAEKESSPDVQVLETAISTTPPRIDEVASSKIQLTTSKRKTPPAEEPKKEDFPAKRCLRVIMK